ncbi:MAG: translation initiation factor IF-3 [Candidatus Yanofskybacteria bacterium CG10_big_fil_rev_8_21_14_0_10_36_16]|uniref:Translation initiation factor IF-3 n=1 Tax=Candidatus Yanofskybacteria bacterium CG10_big_fil_rev_8_21_14_0_10_36_16 TaxID=1975096 RepID=A0A2J0Q822_9BACT|nr:MAG: translation initiation factor IF-3 [Candidatus Yanofskybacteria bacterium CG10_big_fil_rev_8_21_14_0_10_36_16]
MKKFKIYEKRPRANNQIRVPEVKVIDAEGKDLGVMKTHEALKISQAAGLDLIEVGPSSRPPVVKIMDFGKYMYQKSKKGNQKKSVAQEVKGIKIGFQTSIHDLEVRAKQADKFLKKGHRVSIILKLKGREKSKGNVGAEKLNHFLEFITEIHEIESPIKRGPMGFTVTIKPN